MPNDPISVNPNSISFRIKEPAKDGQGNLKLDSLISKENLDLFLHTAKRNPDYAKAKAQYEFRVKQSNGEVFLELKRRRPGFFGKLFAFIGSGRRIAERNDAMFALSKFRGLGLSDVNRLANSRAAYMATTRSNAQQFQRELVEAREQAIDTSMKNRSLWNDFNPNERSTILETAAGRHGMNFFLKDINEEIAFQKVFFALDAIEDHVLTRDEAKIVAEKSFDRYWSQQKQKIELLKSMGLTGMTVEQQYQLEKDLINSGSMNAAYFASARGDASLLAAGLKKLAAIPADDASQRRKFATELMSELKNAALARGLNGLQEFGELAPLVAYVAKGDSENGLDQIENLRETVDFLSELCVDIMMNDDSADHVDKAISAGHMAAITQCLKEFL